MTVNEIIREYGDAFLDAHPFLPLQEKKVLRAISLCRTPALGGHIDVCEDCGHTTMHYHSCRNRHCPQCQFLKQAKWIAEREQELLPFQYFLVVFTLPDELNPLVLRNKKLLCNLLFQKGKETLCSVAQAEKYFGARIGFFAILHTWGQKLNLHPHVHCVVPGGGYDEKSKRWKRAPQDYLFPVAVLKQRFRSLFLTELKKLYTNDDLYVAGTKYQDYQTFRILINSLFQKDWVVYMKESFRSPGSVIKYLGKYTHRIAISNYRIVKVEHDIVSFRYTDYKDGNAKKVMSLPVFSFIKRLLLHVVPRRFVRIRFFGILANRNKADFLKSCHTYFKTTQMQKKNALRSDRIDAYTDRNRCAALFSLWI